MEEVERKEGVPAGASLIVACVAVDELLDGKVSSVDGFTLDSLCYVHSKSSPVRVIPCLAGRKCIFIGDISHVPGNGGYKGK